jgi:hypothetical protein
MPSMLDVTGEHHDIAESVGRMIAASLEADGRFALESPARLDAILDAQRGGPAGAPGFAFAPSPAEMAELGRRTGAMLVLACSLERVRAEETSGSDTIPLDLPFSIRRSPRMTLELALSGRLVDVATGRVVWVGRGGLVRDGRRSKLFADPDKRGGGRLRPEVARAAADDLTAKMIDRFNEWPWLGRVIGTLPDGTLAMCPGGRTGITPGMRFEVFRPLADEGPNPFLPNARRVGLAEVVRVAPDHCSIRPVAGVPQEAIQNGDLLRPAGAGR